MVTWQKHTFEDARHPVSGRKACHCTTCDQFWSGNVSVECPGIPVLRGHDERYATKTQLASERRYPPDENQPDAAYRIRTAPYYGWLYKCETAIARPLTEGQRAGNAKREETIRQKYGCRFCSRRYTKMHHEEGNFQDGACYTCRSRIRTWNDLLASCQKYREEDAFVVQVETKEPLPLARWRTLPKLTLTGVEVWSLSRETPLIERNYPLDAAWGMLRFYLDSGGFPLLFPTRLDLELIHQWLYPDWDLGEKPYHNDFQELWIAHDLARPLQGQKDWRSLGNIVNYYDPKAAPEYYRRLNDLFDFAVEEPLVPAHVVRRIVLSLAEQEPIVFP